MIKYFKKLWKKFFGKTSETLPENVGVEIVEPTPKPQHCGAHSRFIKGCPTCREVVK